MRHELPPSSHNPIRGKMKMLAKAQERLEQARWEAENKMRELQAAAWKAAKVPYGTPGGVHTDEDGILYFESAGPDDEPEPAEEAQLSAVANDG